MTRPSEEEVRQRVRMAMTALIGVPEVDWAAILLPPTDKMVAEEQVAYLIDVLGMLTGLCAGFVQAVGCEDDDCGNPSATELWGWYLVEIADAD